ncbi:TPA: hypothetical protein ACHFWX_005134, partial [Escherichia coli]
MLAAWKACRVLLNRVDT